jgi:hypothetical protein
MLVINTKLYKNLYNLLQMSNMLSTIMQQLKKHQPSKTLHFVSKKIKKYLVMYQVKIITRILASKYKDFIDMGKVKYWNEIFMPDNIIDGNLIKALIATESSFDEKSDKHPKNGHPRGLMQILDKTRQILGDHNGELHDNLVILKAEELFNPSANICAGIRWLFQKKYLLSTHLHKDVSWEEVIIEYKGY